MNKSIKHLRHRDPEQCEKFRSAGRRGQYARRLIHGKLCADKTELQMPVWRLLVGGAKKVPAYITFGLLEFDREQLVEMVRRFPADGQDKFKMVVAIHNAEDPIEDAAHVKAVREAIGEKPDF